MRTWRTRIAEAHDRGSFTHAEHLLAKEWSTCGVGEQLAGTGLRADGDPILMDAGAWFSAAVMSACQMCGCSLYGTKWIAEADATLDQIEDRVLQLKAGLDRSSMVG